MEPNRWNLVAEYHGDDARTRAVRPVLDLSMHSFPEEIAARAETLEVWILPTSNPNLASDEHEADLFDAAGNLLGTVFVREDYDVNELDTRFVPRAQLIADDSYHRRRRRWNEPVAPQH